MSEVIMHGLTPAIVASRALPVEPDQDEQREHLSRDIEALLQGLTDERDRLAERVRELERENKAYSEEIPKMADESAAYECRARYETERAERAEAVASALRATIAAGELAAAYRATSYLWMRASIYGKYGTGYPPEHAEAIANAAEFVKGEPNG